MRIPLEIFLTILSMTALAAGQASAPAKAPRPGTPSAAGSPQAPASSVLPRPSPTPTPPKPNPAVAQAPIANGPKYSPTQLDFGAIDYGASSKKTFSLTPPVSGEVTLEFPGGSFVAAEVRRIPSLNLGQAPGHRALVPPMKPVPALNNGQTEIYKWSFAAGEEMQLDILFAPSFSKDKTPGLRTANMKFSGPGSITPWTVSIPMRGTVSGPLLQPNLVPGPPAQTKQPAAQAKSSVGAALPSAAAPGTLAGHPTPTPAPPPSLGSAPVLNTPVHSPDQFDFGEVWDGDLARKTFHLTTNAAGYVTVQLPQGPFHVAEFREMGAIQQGGSKNAGNKPQNQPLGPVQPVKSKITYLDGQSGPFQWSMAPGVDIQIDIAFQPHFNLMSEIAGQKSATMKVTGPGPHGNWALSVPLRGMFDGLKLQAQIIPVVKEIYAVKGDPKTWISVKLIGLDRDVTGTLRSEGTMPPGVSVVPTQVTVAAKQTVNAVLPLTYGAFPTDTVPRPIQLVFDDGSRKSTAQIQFTGLPRKITLFSGQRGDCGVSRAQLAVVLSAPGPERFFDNQGKAVHVDLRANTLDFEFRGWNLDLIDRRNVWMVAESGGITPFTMAFTLYEHNADETRQKETGWPGGPENYEAWASLVKGTVQFGCQLSEVAGKPKVLNLKWAPGQTNIQ